MTKPIRIGIICPSEIAFRRFLPSVQLCEGIQYVGVAVATPQEWTGNSEADANTLQILEGERAKAQKIVDSYGGKIFNGYQAMIESDEIDAVYLPLPPALHYKWAKITLQNGKHAFVEKPFTTSLADTEELLDIARQKGLAVQENFMFIYHKQLETINDIIESGELGEVRLYRINFGFPRRPKGDFRYVRGLGGGALLDAGGYCVKLASYLLGPSGKLEFASSKDDDQSDVDIFGSGIMKNNAGQIVQFAFGMDCDYKCELEIWGSLGTLYTGRILTAPDGFEPEITIKHNQEYKSLNAPADNSFLRSINVFVDCVNNSDSRNNNYNVIARQSTLMSRFKDLICDEK